MIQQGEQAPDFELPDQDGSPVRLSELRGGSPAPVDAVKRFHDRRSLNFTLLADEDGVVAKVLPKVSPKQHDDLVLAAL